jgi:hypothetical protein
MGLDCRQGQIIVSSTPEVRKSQANKFLFSGAYYVWVVSVMLVLCDDSGA